MQLQPDNTIDWSPPKYSTGTCRNLGREPIYNTKLCITNNKGLNSLFMPQLVSMYNYMYINLFLGNIHLT